MLKAIGNEPVQVYAAPAYGKPGIAFRITNLDLTNTVYFGDNPTVDAGSSPLPEQASSMFDGSTDVWMRNLTTGQIVVVDFAPGSVSWDNPVGVQLALNALGLATAANQATQLTVANSTNTVLGSGIALPIGAAADTTVQAGTDAVLARHAVHPNPYFAGGSSAGWGHGGGANLAIVTSQPAGAPHKYAAQLTPGGANTDPEFSTATQFPCAAGQVIPVRCWYYCTSLTNAGEAPQLRVQFFNAAGGSLGSQILAQLAETGQWVHGHGSFTAPASSASYLYALRVDGNGSNVPAGDVFYVEDFTATPNVPGLPAQDTSVFGVAKDATLTSGIALPIGAAKDATLTGGIALPIGAAKDATLTGGSAIAQPQVSNLLGAVAGASTGAGANIVVSANHRLWGIIFSFYFGASGAYVAAANDIVATLTDPVGSTIARLEMVVLQPSTSGTQAIALPLNGIEEAGTTYTIGMTAPPANVSMRASASILYSVP